VEEERDVHRTGSEPPTETRPPGAKLESRGADELESTRKPRPLVIRDPSPPPPPEMADRRRGAGAGAGSGTSSSMRSSSSKLKSTASASACAIAAAGMGRSGSGAGERELLGWGLASASRGLWQQSPSVVSGCEVVIKEAHVMFLYTTSLKMNWHCESNTNIRAILTGNIRAILTGHV
jgi:hypothetical protein